MTGIPMGGQLLSGMHIFWLVLVLVLVDKKGSGLLAAVLDNVVQFLLGSHLGIYVIPVGIMQGIFAELGYWPLKKYRTVAIVIAGGLSSWANLLVMQFLLNMFGNVYIFGTVSIFAFVSGMILGGCLTIGVVQILQESGMIGKKEEAKKAGIATAFKAIAVVLVCGFILLAAAKFVMPAQSQSTSATTPSYTVNVTDSSGHLTKYDLGALKSSFVTINATSQGSAACDTGPAPSSYTGLPVSYLLHDSGADKIGSSVAITASDGYAQTFKLSDVTGNDNLVLYPSNSTYSLAANGYSPQTWVKNVVSITVS